MHRPATRQLLVSQAGGARTCRFYGARVLQRLVELLPGDDFRWAACCSLRLCIRGRVAAAGGLTLAAQLRVQDRRGWAACGPAAGHTRAAAGGLAKHKCGLCCAVQRESCQLCAGAASQRGCWRLPARPLTLPTPCWCAVDRQGGCDRPTGCQQLHGHENSGCRNQGHPGGAARLQVGREQVARARAFRGW